LRNDTNRDADLAANAKAAKASKGPAKTNGEKKADQIANSVEALKIDDTPRATSKNLDVLAEYEKAKRKNAANFVVIGGFKMSASGGNADKL
jgi:elongation factor 1 alpha-like protein